MLATFRRCRRCRCDAWQRRRHSRPHGRLPDASTASALLSTLLVRAACTESPCAWASDPAQPVSGQFSAAARSLGTPLCHRAPLNATARPCASPRPKPLVLPLKRALREQANDPTAPGESVDQAGRACVTCQSLAAPLPTRAARGPGLCTAAISKRGCGLEGASRCPPPLATHPPAAAACCPRHHRCWTSRQCGAAAAADHAAPTTTDAAAAAMAAAPTSSAGAAACGGNSSRVPVGAGARRALLPSSGPFCTRPPG